MVYKVINDKVVLSQPISKQFLLSKLFHIDARLRRHLKNKLILVGNSIYISLKV